MPVVKCKTCGTRFNAKPCRIAAGKGKFCSRACSGKSRRQVEDDATCAGCGRSFIKSRESQKYCSRECSGPATKIKKKDNVSGVGTKRNTVPFFRGSGLFEDPWSNGDIQPDEYERGVYREPDFVLGF